MICSVQLDRLGSGLALVPVLQSFATRTPEAPIYQLSAHHRSDEQKYLGWNWEEARSVGSQFVWIHEHLSFSELKYKRYRFMQK